MTQQLVSVTFNDEDPIVVAGIPHPGGPTELIDFTATAENAFRAREIARAGTEADEDDLETFRVTFQRYVPEAEDSKEQDESDDQPKPKRQRRQRTARTEDGQELPARKRSNPRSGPKGV